MRGFYPKHQADIEHILKKAPLSNDVFLSIMDEMHTAYSLAEITERELKRNREQYSIHYKRKASEYEAKAKAWDAMKKDFEDIADTPMGQQILFNMSIIKERVERRDSNA